MEQLSYATRTMLLAATALCGGGVVAQGAPMILPTTLAADSMTRSGTQGPYNYGGNKTLYGVAPSQLVWLRFTLPSYNSTLLSDATLTLYAANDTISNVTLEFFALNDDTAGTTEAWIEGTYTGATTAGGDTSDDNWLTHNNQPGGYLSEGSGTNKVTKLGTKVVSSSAKNTPYTFANTDSSSNALVNFLKADSNSSVTFMVRATGTTAIAVYAREDTSNLWQTTIPTGESTLALTIVPEPTSLSLLGLVGMALLRRRRH